MTQENPFEILKNLYLLTKNHDYSRKCFITAFSVMELLEFQGLKTTLVHANITINNQILGHAWLEYNNIIIDLTLPNSRISAKDNYYEQAIIHQSVSYTFTEAKRLHLKTNEFVWCDWIIYDE